MADETATTVLDGPKSRAASGHQLAPGATVDRYVVLEVLGEGGMGVIYRARDPKLDRQVAVKCVRPSRRSSSIPRARERLVREAHALAQLSHPNVVAVYDVGVSGEDVFIAMELVEGKTLKSWLDERPSIAAIRAAFLAAGAGLAAAHKAGLVHRDFKPDNVITGTDGRVRVIDFGLARPPGGSSDDVQSQDGESGDETPPPETISGSPRYAWAANALTRVGAVVGTPAYMAPEQFSGEADALTDQFSFGVSLYEAIYGRRPFRGANRAELIEQMKRGAEEPDGVRVSSRLRKVIRRAMAFDRGARYPSMDELLEDLRRDTRTARTALALGGGAVMFAAIATIGVLRMGDHREPCQGGEARLVGVWDAKIRGAIELSFRQTGVPFADETLQAVRVILDGYTKSALDMQHQSCLATTVRHEQSPELLDLRTACLDRRWTALAALTRELAAAHRSEVVLDAVKAVRALPAVEQCEDAKALRQAYPPPPAAQAQVVAQSYALVDQSRALYLTGDPARGADTARRAITLARNANYPPALAEAHYALGLNIRGIADLADEDATWRAAIAAGSEARDDHLVAEAWTELMAATYEIDPEGALKMETATDSAILRAGNDPVLRSSMLEAKGEAQSMLGKHEDAVASLTKALDLVKNNGESDRNLEALARAQSNLGFELGQLGDTANGLARMEEGTALAVRLYGPHHPQIGHAKFSIGDVSMDLDLYDQAERAFIEAEEIWMKAYGADYRALTSTQIDLGLIASYRGDHASARKKIERAVQITERERGPDHDTSGALYSLYGRVLAAGGDYKGAHKQLDRALAIFTKQKALDTIDAARVYADEAGLAAYEKKYPEAHALYEKALHQFETEDKDGLEVGDMLNGLASCDVETRHFATAAAEANRAAELFGQPDMSPVGLARAHFQLARARWELGSERPAAVALARKALDEFRAVGNYYPDERAAIEAWLAHHH